MTYRLVFREQVADDAARAHAYYEARSAGLGNEFLELFYSSARDIVRNPLLYRVVHRDFRRRLLPRFPYAVYYRVLKEEVAVCGLFHCARDPSTTIRSLDAR